MREDPVFHFFLNINAAIVDQDIPGLWRNVFIKSIKLLLYKNQNKSMPMMCLDCGIISFK
jgi:hypothetical protein